MVKFSHLYEANERAGFIGNKLREEMFNDIIDEMTMVGFNTWSEVRDRDFKESYPEQGVDISWEGAKNGPSYLPARLNIRKRFVTDKTPFYLFEKTEGMTRFVNNNLRDNASFTFNANDPNVIVYDPNGIQLPSSKVWGSETGVYYAANSLDDPYQYLTIDNLTVYFLRSVEFEWDKYTRSIKSYKVIKTPPING